MSSIIYKKMSLAKSGKKNPMHGIHLVGEKNGFFGKKHSEQTKQKMSQKAKKKNKT